VIETPNQNIIIEDITDQVPAFEELGSNEFIFKKPEVPSSITITRGRRDISSDSYDETQPRSQSVSSDERESRTHERRSQSASAHARSPSIKRRQRKQSEDQRKIGRAHV